MLITVNFFSFFRYIAGRDQLSIELIHGATLVELIKALNEKFRSPAFSDKWTVMVVNQKNVLPETELREGDEVFLYPVLEGG